MTATTSPLESDCRALHQSGIAIQKWVVAQPAVKEESLTDWLLYDIDRRSRHFYYKAFSRHEEARRTGADWEWWIVLRTFALRLRVQAKRLHHGVHDHYKDLAYTNRHGLQIVKLLADASANNSIPLYALYSGVHSAAVLCPKGSKTEGVFLASAQRIFNDFIASGPRPVGESDLLAISTPLSCVACCSIGSTPAEYLYHYFVDSGDIRSGEGRQGVHTELPRYVEEVLQARSSMPDWWEQEHGREFEDLGGILIYDARDRSFAPDGEPESRNQS